MSTLDYRGHQLPYEKSDDLKAALQLVLTDLTTIGNAAQGLAKDVATTIARENNRDEWEKSFFDWTVSNVNRLGLLVNQAAAVGAIGMLKSQLSAALPATDQPAAAPAPTPSPHRLQPGPTGAPLATGLPAVGFGAGSTDRAHTCIFDFTAGYPGGTFIAQITFATPYSSPPVVHIQQLDALGFILPRVRDVTETGYIIDCEPFLLAALYQVSVTVIHPSDSFD